MSQNRSDFSINTPQPSSMKNYNITAIKPLVDAAKKALIVVPQISIDAVGSALALALTLKSKNIESQIYCPQKTDQNYSKLAGLELLSDTINLGNLVVTLDYPLDQIDQVSYNDNGGKLNLVVTTKTGSPQIQSDKININNSSSQSDLGFMLGDETSLPNADQLKQSGNWVYIASQDAQKDWAKTKLIDADAPFSEIFTFLLPMLGLPLTPDAAKNLLIGLRVSTQSFSVNVSPETFEAGAACLKASQAEPVPVTATPVLEKVETGTNQPSPMPTA